MRSLPPMARWPGFRAYFRWGLRGFPLQYTQALSDREREGLVNVATPEEKARPLYACLVSPYWLEALARFVSAKHGIDRRLAEDLLKVHTAREEGRTAQASWLSGRRLAAILVTAASFIASQVPKESFEELGWPHAYGWYRLALLGILVYALAMILGFERMRTRALNRRITPHISTLTRLVLIYNTTGDAGDGSGLRGAAMSPPG